MLLQTVEARSMPFCAAVVRLVCSNVHGFRDGTLPVLRCLRLEAW